MLDQIIVLAYLAIVLIIGLMSGRNTVSLEDYAIGKRNFSNPVLAAGIAATMIAASGTSGLTGKIYTVGLISALSYLLGVAVSRMLIAFVVAPKMTKFLGLISSGDIFEKLYGKEARLLIGVLTLIEGPLLTGAQILATYQACQIFFGLSKEFAAISTTLITVAYCFRGGIRAVTTTDVFQFIIMMIAIPIVATMSIEKIGGISEFVAALNQKHLFLDSVFHGDITKHSIIFVSLAITCVFPLTIQRMLMAKNVTQIKKAFFINGLITVFFYTAIGIIGLSAAIILPNIDPNFALPALIDEILPIGIRGIVIAGLIAIFMSSSDSDMNITSIALTQDLLKPLLGSKLSDKVSYIITRMSFVLTGVIATVIALYFSNALDILFLLMVIANSVYCPGMLFGILGVVPSKKGFWIGVFAGAMTAGIMCIGYGVFPLYAMMSAILANSTALLVSCHMSWAKKVGLIEALTLKLRPIFRARDTFFEFKKSDYLVSTSSYCDIFATLVLLNSMTPFFLKAIYLGPLPHILIATNVMSSVLAVLLLLRQSFNHSFNWLFPIIWQATVFFSLTFTTALSIAQNKFNLMLLFDIFAVLSLLVLLLRKHELFAHVGLFLICSTAIMATNKTVSIDTNEFQYWSVFLHSLALILCLTLFRKREVAAYKFMTLKFAHEAGRTVSSVSTSASLLEAYLGVWGAMEQPSHLRDVS